jgi:hypothetical protein
MPIYKSLILFVLLAIFLVPSLASANGGLTTGSPEEPSAKVKKATLVKGRAIAPDSAPKRVKQVIAAANQIRNKPYKWGGGHARWNDSGYDCSGAVSFALRGGKFLSSPLNSTGLGRFGNKGKGRWISVYGASNHAYMVVAGLRFDTGYVQGNGPGWSKSMQTVPGNYKTRHPKNY